MFKSGFQFCGQTSFFGAECYFCLFLFQFKFQLINGDVAKSGRQATIESNVSVSWERRQNSSDTQMHGKEDTAYEMRRRTFVHLCIVIISLWSEWSFSNWGKRGQLWRCSDPFQVMSPWLVLCDFNQCLDYIRTKTGKSPNNSDDKTCAPER